MATQYALNEGQEKSAVAITAPADGASDVIVQVRSGVTRQAALDALERIWQRIIEDTTVAP